MKPQISVIVPVYNVESYLDRCISSILNQSFQDFELILIDDASPDLCPQLCDGYAKKDGRVTVIHLDSNVGLSEARNQGLAMARGEYISFIDSDDWVEGNFFEVMLTKAQATKSDIVACTVYKTTGASLTNNNIDRPDIIYSTNEALINIFTSSETIAHTAWNKLYKRSLFDSGITYPKGLLHEDILTTYKLIAQANQVCFTEQTAYNYFQSMTSITRGQFNPKRLEVLSHLPAIQNNIKSADRNVSEAISYFEFSMTNYFIDYLKDNPSLASQRRLLIDTLAHKRQTLWHNKYLSFKEKVMLQLMALPWLYDQLYSLK